MIYIIPPEASEGMGQEKYMVRDNECLGCACLNPGEVEMQSKEYLGRPTKFGVCLTMWKTTCPQNNERGFDAEEMWRKFRAGWRTARI